MRLKEILETHKETITKRWFESVIAAYPEETVKFLKAGKDPFANPVGHNIKEGITGIVEAIIEDKEEVEDFLDRIIRIRAVQDLSPSEAIGFIFDLKGIIRQVVPEMEMSLADEIDRRVDVLALKAFDIYMECKRKLYELRATELRNMTYKLLERANLLNEIEEF